jgi:hypothetical protein
MFYLIGTLYPLLARATYPALHFPQHPGGRSRTSAADDAIKAQAQKDAQAALAVPRAAPKVRGFLRRLFCRSRGSLSASLRPENENGEPPVPWKLPANRNLWERLDSNQRRHS